MAGRPTKLTKEIQLSICDSIESGATYKDAAGMAGVGYSTFNDWMKLGREAKRKNRYSEFSEAVERSNSIVRVKMAAVIRDAAIVDKDWRAALEFNKRRDPENWGDKQAVDHTSGGDKIGVIGLGLDTDKV